MSCRADNPPHLQIIFRIDKEGVIDMMIYNAQHMTSFVQKILVDS